jgi:hypothetical protein
MAEIILVCVSNDLPQAEGLAEMFEGAGYVVRDDVFNDVTLARAAAGVLVLSRAAFACERFRDAAQRLLDAEKAVVACLDPGQGDPLGDATRIDLSGWYGQARDPMLDPLLMAVDRARADGRRRARARWREDEAKTGAPPRTPEVAHAQV